MMASAFVQPHRRAFPSWARYVSYVPLYGIGVPLVRLLEVAGRWPEVASGAMRRAIGDFGEYQPRASDVIVCSGFKSGTTWLLQMALQIAFRGEADFDNLHSAVAWPDAPGMLRKCIVPLADDSPRLCSPTGLRIIKTHHAPNRVPYADSARYIALVRDPKDVIVSGYHFLRSMAFGPLMPTVERWVDSFLDGGTSTGPWAEHAAGWWRMRHRPNVLFLTYEAMRRDPGAAIARVAEFMGVALTADEFEAIARKSSFPYMKQLQAKFDPGRVVPWGGEDYMLRRGRSGNSAELLSPALQARIDARCRAELARLGCDFPYDLEFAPAARESPPVSGAHEDAI
jgi:hypothetical protein